MSGEGRGAEKATGNPARKQDGKKRMRGNPLLEKRCSAHGDHA
jgi:hypothetical protein